MSTSYLSFLERLLEYLPLFEQPGRKFGVKKGERLVEFPEEMRRFAKLVDQLSFGTDLHDTPIKDLLGLFYNRERVAAETDLPTLCVLLHAMFRSADRDDNPDASLLWLLESGHVGTVLHRIQQLRNQAVHSPASTVHQSP